MDRGRHHAHPGAPTAPLYRQIALRLETAIRDGHIVAGRELGNEILLAARFGVSRATMRRAILELVDKGLLVRKRGVGTHVVGAMPNGRSEAISRELRLSSLHDDLSAMDRQPATVVLDYETIRPPQVVVEALALSPGNPALHLRRLRFANQRPLAIMENYLPTDVLGIAAFDPATTSLYGALRDRGLSLHVSKQRIGARSGTDEECRLLEEPSGSPILTMDRISQDRTGRVVEVASHLYRATLHQYTLTLVER